MLSSVDQRICKLDSFKLQEVNPINPCYKYKNVQQLSLWPKETSVHDFTL
jgi:hypothetical protein